MIGYFSHLDNRTPDETQYFDYGLPLIKMYREHVYQLMHAYASAKHAQKKADDVAAESLLSEIRTLSEKTHAQVPPAFNDFQKQIVVTKPRIEKTLIDRARSRVSLN